MMQAGTITPLFTTSTRAGLVASAATGGVAPYTYQWYRATSPVGLVAPGNALVGQTSLILNDTGLIPATTYYYTLMATDNVASAATYSFVTLTAAGDIPEYYADLLILQYRGQPKARATVEALSAQVAMDELPALVQNAFTPATAVGVQLDIVGKYAGVTRTGVGIHGQSITLDDDDFRQLVQIAIIRNRSNSSLAAIQTLLTQFFPGQLFVTDYLNMRIGYIASTTVGSSELIQLFITEDLLPRPMGVALVPTVFVPNPGEVFGFSTPAGPAVGVSGFNDPVSYNTSRPWLGPNNVIVV